MLDDIANLSIGMTNYEIVEDERGYNTGQYIKLQNNDEIKSFFKEHNKRVFQSGDLARYDEKGNNSIKDPTNNVVTYDDLNIND